MDEVGRSSATREGGEARAGRDADEPGTDEPRGGLVEVVRDQPVATGTLLASVLAGAIAGFVYLPADVFSPARRVVGGALIGGLSWLLVMVGRII